MDRRKFLIGAGSLAAGSAAAMGTGAFNFANVERTAKINVAGDASAYLGIETSQSPYAEQPNKQAQIVLNGEAGVSGSGVNANADMRFDHVLGLRNNGDTEVALQITDNGANDDVFRMWVEGDDTLSDGTRVDDTDADLTLEVGEIVYLNAGVFLRNNSASDLPSKITITADESLPPGEGSD